jgi:hypothetical protein
MLTTHTCRATGCQAEAVTGIVGATHAPILVCPQHRDDFADRVPYDFTPDRTGMTFAARK